MKKPWIISRRAAILGLAFLSGEMAQAESAGCIRMVGPSPSEEVVKTTAESLEAACNSRDVIGVRLKWHEKAVLGPVFASRVTARRAVNFCLKNNEPEATQPLTGERIFSGCGSQWGGATLLV